MIQQHDPARREGIEGDDDTDEADPSYGVFEVEVEVLS